MFFLLKFVSGLTTAIIAFRFTPQGPMAKAKRNEPLVHK